MGDPHESNAASVRWRILGALAGAAALVMAFWQVEPAALYAILRGSDRSAVLLVVSLTFVVVVLRAWRWRALLGAAQKLPFAVVLQSTIAGIVANAALPARAGELVRVVFLARRLRDRPEHAPSTRPLGTTALLASVGLDHLVEAAGMIVLLALLPLVTPAPAWLLPVTWTLLAAVAALLVICLMLAGPRRHVWVTRLPLPARLTAWVQARLLSSIVGLKAMRSPRHLSRAFTLGLAAWLVQAAMVWLCLMAMQLPLGVFGAVLVLMAVNVGLLAPGAPGSVGTFELSVVLAMGFLGVPKAPALAFALLYHAVQLIPSIVVGSVVLLFWGAGWRDLKPAGDHNE